MTRKSKKVRSSKRAYTRTRTNTCTNTHTRTHTELAKPVPDEDLVPDHRFTAHEFRSYHPTTRCASPLKPTSFGNDLFSYQSKAYPRVPGFSPASTISSGCDGEQSTGGDHPISALRGDRSVVASSPMPLSPSASRVPGFSPASTGNSGCDGEQSTDGDHPISALRGDRSVVAPGPTPLSPSASTSNGNGNQKPQQRRMLRCNGMMRCAVCFTQMTEADATAQVPCLCANSVGMEGSSDGSAKNGNDNRSNSSRNSNSSSSNSSSNDTNTSTSTSVGMEGSSDGSAKNGNGNRSNSSSNSSSSSSSNSSSSNSNSSSSNLSELAFGGAQIKNGDRRYEPIPGNTDMQNLQAREASTSVGMEGINNSNDDHSNNSSGSNNSSCKGSTNLGFGIGELLFESRVELRTLSEESGRDPVPRVTFLPSRPEFFDNCTLSPRQKNYVKDLTSWRKFGGGIKWNATDALVEKGAAVPSEDENIAVQLQKLPASSFARISQSDGNGPHIEATFR